MTKKRDPYDQDKEKRDLAQARSEETRSRTTQRQNDPYTTKHGFPNLSTMTEAENATEKRLTNQRLTDNAATNSKIEALKAMAVAGVGSPHSQAALDELAKIAGVTVPKTVDPKQAALNKVRAAKGLPPLGGEEAKPGTTDGLVSQPQQQSQPSLFQPDYSQEEAGPSPGTQPVPAGNTEVGFGSPVTPHLGIGGAAITPENPTGNPENPWGAGGLLDNPTHAAARNVQAREALVHPFGSDNRSPIGSTYFPGEAMDRLAGGGFQPTRLVAPSVSARPAGRNVPPQENILPSPVTTLQTQSNILPPPPQQGWNTKPGGTLGQDWLRAILAGQNTKQPVRREPVY